MQINTALIGQPVESHVRIAKATAVTAEIERILNHRLARSSHYRNGIPEGHRDAFLTVLVSVCAESLTHAQIKAGELEKRIEQYANRYTSPEFARDYLGKDMCKTVVDRAHRSTMGEFVIFMGRRKDTRYGYSVKRIIEELEVKEAEIDYLNLRHIADSKRRERYKKQDKRGSKPQKIKTAKNSKSISDIKSAQFSDNEQNISEFAKFCPSSIRKKKRERKAIFKSQDLPTSPPVKYVQSWEARAKKISGLIKLKKGFEENFEFYVQSYCVELSSEQRKRMLDFSRVDVTESTMCDIRRQIIYMSKVEQLLTAINLTNHLNSRLNDNPVISKTRDLVSEFLDKVNFKRQKLAQNLEFETVKNEVYHLQLFDPYLAKKRVAEYLEESRVKYAKFQKCSMIIGSKATALKRVIILANRQLPVDHEQIDTADLVPW